MHSGYAELCRGEETMSDDKAVDTFQQIIAQIVERLAAEGETEEK